MLQRAASNAYSWWWASHIRTKQSKWLDTNLQEMEVKVEDILKLIEEDGDSFAQKAEMYYRKRPELINFVEEFYRAYRSLAERYDHISGELHKANNTIATVFPDQLQLTMEYEEDFNSPEATTVDSSKIQKAVPAVPKNPPKKLINKAMISPLPVMPRPTKSTPQVDKEKAQEEIDKLQKGILVLQTEKEFIKSSYESNLAKYWHIEKRITEMQQEVCCLQDDYSVSMIIEDDEARALMAATALKSCEDALIDLQEQQKRSAEEARKESGRIKVASEKLNALKGDQPPSAVQEQPEEVTEQSSGMMNVMVEASGLKQERLELQTVCEKIKQHFDMSSEMSVEELAEKIDVLAEKVITLEVTVSSQTAQINRLRLETDELHKHLQTLEEEKVTLADGSKSLNEKLKHAEEELCRLQFLDKCFQEESQKLQTHFTEACDNFNDLSKKLQPTDEVHDAICPGSQQAEFVHSNSTQEECNDREYVKACIDESNTSSDDLTEEVSHAIHEPDFCIKNQDVYTHLEENCIPDDPTEKPAEQKQEDETQRTNYVPDDVAGQLAGLKQEDKIKNADFVPGDSIGILTESEQEDETGKVNRIPVVEQEKEDEVRKTDSVQKTENIHVNDERQMENVEQDYSPNWQKFFLDGLEDREKLLLAEYTSILRNYKETKRKLSEAEKKHQDHLFETMSKMRDLKNANAMKDEEIRSLRQKLQFLETSACEISDSCLGESKASQLPQRSASTNKREASLFSPSFGRYANGENSRTLKNEKVESQSTVEVNGSHEENTADSPLSKGVNLHVPNEPEAASAVEEKFRRDIDELLEENLEFWLRFSSSFHQVQKFQKVFQDIEAEILKLKDVKKQEGSTTSSGTSSGEVSVKPEATPVYKHLRDLQTDLSIWLDHHAHLKVELQCRFSSLCNIKEEISRFSSDTPEAEEAQLTAYQAAKFHGEVLNMQQENNKVADELQAGMDHVKGLQAEVEQTLVRLHQNFELSASAKGHHHLYHFRNFSSRTRIPLRSFLFGVKPKSKKPSIFSCMNPALQKQYSDLTAAVPP